MATSVARAQPPKAARAARGAAAPAAAPPKPRPPQGGMALPSVLCLALALAALAVAVPRFRVGAVALPFEAQAGLLGAAFLAGAWGAFAARERRALLGFAAAAVLLAPAADARLPLERLPLLAGAAALFVLAAELALLNARLARLAGMPRAHVTQGGQGRETDLRSLGGRIAGGLVGPLALAVGLVAASWGLAQGLGAALPPALGDSLELRGPAGLALGAVVVLGSLGLLAWRRERAATRAEVAPPQGGADEAEQPRA